MPTLPPTPESAPPPESSDGSRATRPAPMVDLSNPQDQAAVRLPNTASEGPILGDFSIDGFQVANDAGGSPPEKDGDGAAEDGDSETTGPDGTKVRTGPGGVAVEYPDGRTEFTDPEGNVTVKHPEEVHNKDGTAEKTYPYDGRKETTGFNENDAREKVTEYPNGRKVTENKDGSKATTFEPSDPEKRASEHVSSDGHVTTTKYRDGHTEEVDDRTGDVVKSYPPRNGKPGYNVTIGKDDNGNSTVVTGPYEELKPVK